MKGSDLEERKVFLVASGNPELRQKFAQMIESKFSSTMVYQAIDGADALFKIKNAPPHVALIDPELPKVSGFEVVQQVLGDKSAGDFSMILLALAPEHHVFVDEVVSGRVQFLNKDHPSKADRVHASLRGAR
jgi:CheY-like chemotaxis protein